MAVEGRAQPRARTWATERERDRRQTSTGEACPTGRYRPTGLIEGERSHGNRAERMNREREGTKSKDSA